MRKGKATWFLSLLGITMLVAGCGNAQKDATEAAINAAQAAINAATNAAEKFVPEQTKAAQDALQAAKDSLAKGDYGDALKNARDAAQKAQGAISAASAKKEEWRKSWDSLSASVPRAMGEMQTKVDAYTKRGKLPPGIDKETMEEVKARFEQLKQGWSEATAAYKHGNWADAMKKASIFKEGLQKLKELLGIQP